MIPSKRPMNKPVVKVGDDDALVILHTRYWWEGVKAWLLHSTATTKRVIKRKN